MTWADIVGDTIRVAQQKTAAKLTIPIHETLYRVLSTASRSHSTILATAYGERFSVKGFGQMISTAIREAGLPERCKAHGLRKAAARRLAEAGCSASEIAAITGHKTLAEVERYTRAADQERLARQAIQRQSENRSGKPLIDEVANTTDEASKINSLIWKMALPREARQSNEFNALRKCLGRNPLIVVQGVSGSPPKRKARASSAWVRKSVIFFRSATCRANLNLKGYGEFDAANRPSGWNTWLTFSISPMAPTSTLAPTQHRIVK